MTALADIPAAVSRVRDGASAGLLDGEEARVTQLRQIKRMIEENEGPITAALSGFFTLQIMSFCSLWFIVF